jgi:hypothetical protein
MSAPPPAFSALFDEFIQSTSNVLYQFSLASCHGIESDTYQPSIPPFKSLQRERKPPKPKEPITEENIDDFLLRLISRSKFSWDSKEILRNAQTRTKWPKATLQQRLLSLFEEGRIPLKPDQSES